MNLVESIKQPVTRSVTFLEECWAELKRVHFPTRKETQAATVVVIVGVLIVGLYLGVVDWALTRLVTQILG
jgi:preprotein translocase subunit SecE